jgi:Raf kinase inhibitor-like YbhB/YbcL family protein
MMAFQLTSSAFGDGQPIPTKYTADGDDVSPPLEWHDVPEGTKSFALIVEDPDAPSGMFRHWALYNISGDADHLTEGHGNRETVVTGVNDFGDRGYRGPAPPKGHGTHHYHFKLAALDVENIDAPKDAKVEEIWSIAKDHAIEVAQLTGTYQR